MVDPNSGKLTGIVVEAMEIAAKNLGLKVEWTEEVGFGSMVEGIKAKRYELVPSAIWPNAARSRHVDFSISLFYSGVGIYVREDDDRFINNIKAINSKDVTISTMDGEMAETIARTDFPEAKTLQVPQLSEITTMLLNVKNNKADVTFVELFFAHEFLKNNPGSIKNITPDKPIRVFPNTIMLKKGEFKLKSMLNTALRELIYQGVIDRLLDKYEPAPGLFYRLSAPYRTTKD
jgi:ABC-type amino acid transport substrate-binding protein